MSNHFLKTMILCCGVVALFCARTASARWSAQDQIVNQMSTDKQFNIRGEFTIQALPGQIHGRILVVTIEGKWNGEKIKPLRVKMRHTQRGVNALRAGETLHCKSIWLQGKKLLKYH